MGNFCSEACEEKNAAFVNRAAELEAASRNKPLFAGLARRVGKLLKWAVLLLIAAVIATFFGVNVPVVSDLVDSVLGP